MSLSAAKIMEINDKVKLIAIQLGSTKPGVKIRTVTPVAKRLLLISPYFYDGNSINVKAKSIGAGVYEVWNESL